MAGFLASISLIAAVSGLAVALIGLRWLQTDARLRARVDGRATSGTSGAAAAGRNWRTMRAPARCWRKGATRLRSRSACARRAISSQARSTYSWRCVWVRRWRSWSHRWRPALWSPAIRSSRSSRLSH
ncbi:hypothetical protein ACFSLT_27690 [Novosphingobium resinovorum]